MELDELKTLWQEDSERLQKSLLLNKKLIRKGSITKYEKHLWFMLLGRNLALVYAAISIVLAIYYFSSLIYSIPLLIGAAAMIWSFNSHLAMEGKADYQALSILEMQKRIHRFRMHIAKSKSYDGLIVVLWFLTATPPYLKYSMDYDIYASFSNLIPLIGPAFIIFIIFAYITNRLYKWTDDDMKDAESILEEIHLFEDSSL